MREILFRGKRTDFNRWIEGYLYRLSEKLNPFIMIKNQGGVAFEVIPETVGQYTGLTDNNGTKIFDGDILKQYGFCYVVSFENGSFVAYETPYNESAILPRTDWGNAVVVGNIHDNPELLKGGDE